MAYEVSLVYMRLQCPCTGYPTLIDKMVAIKRINRRIAVNASRRQIADNLRKCESWRNQ